MHNLANDYQNATLLNKTVNGTKSNQTLQSRENYGKLTLTKIMATSLADTTQECPTAFWNYGASKKAHFN